MILDALHMKDRSASIYHRSSASGDYECGRLSLTTNGTDVSVLCEPHNEQDVLLWSPPTMRRGPSSVIAASNIWSRAICIVL
jgi:hypothetical protein